MRSLRESRQAKLSRLLDRKTLFEKKLAEVKTHWKSLFNYRSSSEALDMTMVLMDDYRNELVRIDKKIARLKRKIKEKN